MLITFEGIDKCGKSTQALLLYKYLVRLGYAVILTKEPTDDFIGSMIRKVLRKEIQIQDPKSLCLLYVADRYEHLKSLILPALKSNKIVICDRFSLSTKTYQFINGVDSEYIRLVNRYSIEPDLTFYLDIDPKEAIKRIDQGKEEYFEKEEFLTKAREQYLNQIDLAYVFAFIIKQNNVTNMYKQIIEIIDDKLKDIEK